MSTGKSSLLPPLSELRRTSRRLLKKFRSGSLEAATRLQRLRSFAEKSPAELLEQGERVRLKHALLTVALEHGYESWTALLSAARAQFPSPPPPRPGREMYEHGLDVLLNRWFASYEDARRSREERGGFLLPFDRQFFICEEEGIRVLGLDPDDPDWRRIGWDWVRPQDRAAWERLRSKREKARGAQP